MKNIEKWFSNHPSWQQNGWNSMIFSNWSTSPESTSEVDFHISRSHDSLNSLGGEGRARCKAGRGLEDDLLIELEGARLLKVESEWKL